MAPSAGADPDVAARAAFAEVDLSADLAGHAPLVDAGLINPWGMALGATGPLWVANNGSDTATIYPGGAGGTPVTKAGLTVAVPGGAPTGQVANGTTDFVVTGLGGLGPARFIFIGETGDLTAWNPTASPRAPSLSRMWTVRCTRVWRCSRPSATAPTTGRSPSTAGGPCCPAPPPAPAPTASGSAPAPVTRPTGLVGVLRPAG